MEESIEKGQSSMSNNFSRRRMMQALGAVPLMPAALAAADASWPPPTDKNVPKICLGGPQTIDEAGIRRFKQIGVDAVLMGGPRSPWTEESLKAIMDKYTAGGMQVINMMIGGINNVIYGKAGADQEIQNVITSIRAAGKVGLPVIEYNFYANRLMEGYKEEIGRGGSGLTAYDYELSKSLPPREGVGTHTRAEQLKRAEGFLKAVIPEAEKANVRLALHPNDPPVPTSRGSEQLMATFAHWKEYLSLVKSPYNGMTFDCGVTRETGEDPVAVAKWMGERDQINHVHFRNVKVRKPYVDYTEVWLDEGMVNMFAVMKELVRQKYPRGLYPEHARAIDYDRERGIRNQYPGGGGFGAEMYNVGFTKAMLLAALS
jgi:mannonate dehydratase